MKNKSDFKYITVPLSAIKRLYTNPKTAIEDIFYIGILQVSKYEDIDETAAIRQLLYCYYRESNELTHYLKLKFETLIADDVFIPDEDYNGFSGDEFNPEDDIYSIGSYIEDNQDTEFQKAIMEFHAVRQLKGVFNMKFNTGSIIDKGNKLIANLPDGDALITIKTDMMFDFYKNKKTAYEIDMFACYLGIRSILGKKEFCFTTRKMILCRMIGCKSSKDIKDATKIKELKKVYESYSIDYRMTKLLDNLVVNNFISKIAVKALRRTYISTQFNMEELEQAIKSDLQNNSKKRIQKNKQDEKDAASRILSSLKPKNN